MLENLHFDHPLKSSLFKKIESLGYKIFLISRDNFLVYPSSIDVIDDPNILELRKLWESIRNQFKKDQFSETFQKTLINSIGNLSKVPPNPQIWQLRQDTTGKSIVIFSDHLNQFPWYDVNMLLNTKMIEEGRLPIHSNGLIIGHKILLFSGTSGAGKSTVAALGQSVGAKVLDEDQVLIREVQTGIFSADAWGYSLEKSEAIIVGVIKLIQSKADKLTPISETKTAHFIFHQTLEVCGREDSMIRKIFAYSAKLARHIPGYELRFTKSANFWRLIKKEFGI